MRKSTYTVGLLCAFALSACSTIGSPTSAQSFFSALERSDIKSASQYMEAALSEGGSRQASVLQYLKHVDNRSDFESVFRHYREEVSSTTDPSRLINLTHIFQRHYDRKLIDEKKRDELLLAIDNRAAAANMDGEIPFTLWRSYEEEFPSLSSPEAKLIVFDRSLKTVDLNSQHQRQVLTDYLYHSASEQEIKWFEDYVADQSANPGLQEKLLALRDAEPRALVVKAANKEKEMEALSEEFLSFTHDLQGNILDIVTALELVYYSPKFLAGREATKSRALLNRAVLDHEDFDQTLVYGKLQSMVFGALMAVSVGHDLLNEKEKVLEFKQVLGWF